MGEHWWRSCGGGAVVGSSGGRAVVDEQWRNGAVLGVIQEGGEGRGGEGRGEEEKGGKTGARRRTHRHTEIIKGSELYTSGKQLCEN